MFDKLGSKTMRQKDLNKIRFPSYQKSKVDPKYKFILDHKKRSPANS